MKDYKVYELHSKEKIRFGLSLKLVVAFLVISLPPLAILLYLNLQANRTALQTEAYKSLAASSQLTSQRLNGFIEYNLGVISAEANLPIIARFLNLSPEDQEKPHHRKHLAETLTSLMDKNRLFLSSYAILDITGRNIYDSDPSHIGSDLSKRCYFRQALETGLAFASDAQFDQDTGKAFLYFSSPIKAPSGRIIGVLRARYSATVIQQLILQDTGLLGPGSFAMVVNSQDLILAYGIFSHGGVDKMMFNPIKRISIEKMQTLQEMRLYPPHMDGNLYNGIMDLRKGLQNANTVQPFFTTSLPSTGEKRFAAALTHTEKVPWRVVFFQPQNAFLASEKRNKKSMLYLSVIAAVFVSITALSLTRYLSRPVRELTRVAKRISQGDLSAVYIPKTRDEIGVLADTFNFMTRRLRKRIEMEKLLSAISRHFISLDAGDTTIAIDAALQEIADFAGIDRCLLFQIADPDNGCFVMTHEWSRGTWPKIHDSLQSVPKNESAEIIRLIDEDQKMEIIDSEKSQDALARFWQNRGSRSVLCSGFTIPGNFYGFVGFESIRIVRHWLPEEFYLLHMTGEIIRSTLERQQVEKDKAIVEEQLRHSTKMEAVGTLAGGIAHDFNNLLQGVSGYIQLLLALKDENHEDRQYLEKANNALNRSAKLVQRLLTLSRKSQSSFKPVDINEIANSTIDLLQHAIPKMITIKLNLTPELPVVRADANQIEQVLVNLVNNAVDAMEGAGRLTMETGMFHMVAQPYATLLKLEPGDYVLMQVSDTGMGIDEKTRQQIFDAFFTTKEVGKGTGLGLAISYNIIENHGGHIACYSEVGEGTTFKIYLPVDTETKACELPDTKVRKDRLRGTETILLVDDEEDIRETSKKFLSTCGYNVFTSASAEEALERYRAQEEEIDLILMDLGMPGMGGEKGLAAFLKYDRNLKIIIASGYSAHRIAKAPQDYGAARFVTKPYDFVQLNKTIQEVVGGD